MTASILFNPRSPEFRDDPVSVYDALRDQGPVFQNTEDTWVSVGYNSSLLILREPKLISKASEWRLSHMSPGPFRHYCQNTMAFMDGEHHKGVRSALSPAFGPANIKKLTETVEKLCDEIVLPLKKQPQFDFITDVATPLPLYVICEILGIPRDYRELFGHGAHCIVSALEPMASQDIIDAADAACAELSEIVIAYAEQRPADPDGDLISFMKAQHEASHLTWDEFVQHIIFILAAGHETTSTLISQAMNHLLKNPEVADELRDDPSLTATAVSECLRLYPPLQFVMRVADEAFDIGGVTVPAGNKIFVLLGAANRDPEMFPEPNKLDLRRKNAAQNLAFIAGPHTCLGNNLARMESRIAFERVLRHMPQLRFDGDPTPNLNFVFQGFRNMPVRQEV